MTFLVVAVLVVVAVILIRRRRRARRMPVAAALPSADEAVPVFNVVALGARGSGKTLLLASMYHELQVPAGRSYFVTTSHEQVIMLNQWYSEASDSGRDWPAGTLAGETRTFTFTVRTRMPTGAVRPVMDLAYLEYAGGLLTDVQAPGSTRQAEVLRGVETAHALIGIIDGYRIRQMMDGVDEGRLRLRQSLDTMISLMLRQTCPVTFVITKWDLLRDLDVDDDARLQIVKKRLMHLQGFRDLVEQHSYQRVVRLIPVSAVGSDFAALDDDGRVTKLPGAEVHPSNVDVPLCAVVPDLFEQVEHDVDTARLKGEFDRIRRQTRLGPAAAMAELGTFLARTAGGTLLALGPRAVGFLGDAALALLHDSREEDRGARQGEVDRLLTVAERDLADFRSARRRVLRDLQRRVDVLEGRLPSSRLSGED